MIIEIDYNKFNENLIKGKYKFVFGKQQGEFRYGRYELNLSDSFLVGIYSNGLSKPALFQKDNILAIIVNNEVHFIDIVSEELLKSFYLQGPAYEVLFTDKKIVVLGEIDVLILNNNLNLLKHNELSDILTDYKIDDGKLRYSLMEGSKFEEQL